MDPCPECGYQPTHEVSFHAPGDPLVKIIGFWPVEERSHRAHDSRFLSKCYYNTACSNANYDLQLIEEPDQAVLIPGIPVVSLEEPHLIDITASIEENIQASADPPSDVIEISAFNHPLSAIYILGNTLYQRPSDYFDVDYKLGIRTANDRMPLYGAQLVTLIWYDRRLTLDGG